MFHRDDIEYSPRRALGSWLQHLQSLAPKGANVNMRNGVGDAFRHYMSYATLSQFVGAPVARTVGNLGESGSTNPEEEKKMDLQNNEAGIAAGEDKHATSFELAIKFNIDSSQGKTQVIDSETGKARPMNPKDVGGYNGAPVEHEYQHPDRSPNDMSGSDDGTMIA